MEGWLGLLIDVLRNGYNKGAMNVWLEKFMNKMDAGGQIDGCLSSVHNSSNPSMPIHPPADLLIHSFIRVSYSSNHPSIQRESDKSVKGVWCASQLAVYGACKCSSSTGEPCSCAKSAAASRKQVLQLQQEVCICESV